MIVGSLDKLTQVAIANDAEGKMLTQAKIEGSTVVISAEGVANPKAARYGWANVPDVNLFNKEGLPASPFRTDVD